MIFTSFMCCQKQQECEAVADQQKTAQAETPMAESLEVKRAQFQIKLSEARALVRERNAAPEVVYPSNPTQDVLSQSKRNLPQK